MSVFTTLHIACRHSCTLHTLVFLQGGLPPELRVLHHNPRSLYMYDLWVREEQVLVCCYTFISTFYTMYLTTGRQQRMDIYTTVSEKPASLLPTACQHERRVATDLSSYLLCPADSWPPTIQHDLSILAECQGHCPVMWGHVHQRLWLWCYVGVFSYAKNQGTKAILLSKILPPLLFDSRYVGHQCMVQCWFTVKKVDQVLASVSIFWRTYMIHLNLYCVQSRQWWCYVMLRTVTVLYSTVCAGNFLENSSFLV